MKNILCFGDSNTWGFDPEASSRSPFPIRHPLEVRWTGVAQRALGPDYRLIEEGLNGRTTVHDDPLEDFRNGRTYLMPCLYSHNPIDAVVLMLGCNDLKARFDLPPGDIAEGAALLARLIQQSATGPGATAPLVLLVCPPAVTDLLHLPLLNEKFAGAHEKSLLLPPLFAAWADRLGCAYLNSQALTQTSLIDGLHLEAPEHAKLGTAIAQALRKLL